MKISYVAWNFGCLVALVTCQSMMWVYAMYRYIVELSWKMTHVLLGFISLHLSALKEWHVTDRSLAVLCLVSKTIAT